MLENEPKMLLSWILIPYLMARSKCILSALVLITGIVWALVLYLKYFYRRKKMIEKMDEIRRGPSHTLAMMGLSIIMPFAPGKFFYVT